MAALRFGAATDTGQLRPANEDSLLVTDRVFVVADGMGGHEAGEVASKLAVDRISESLRDKIPTATDVVEAITAANGDIFRAAIANPGQQGMGTTVTAIAVIADHHAGRGAPNLDAVTGGLEGRSDQTDRPDADTVADGTTDADQPGDIDAEPPGDLTPITPAEPSEALVLANVGDSRTYLFRHQKLRRVTVDHSYVQELVATGHISEEEARTHPRRNIITRALGIEPDVRVDWWTLPLIRGDRFVLCSDGLVDEVADSDITSTLILEADPQAAADRLVEKANEAGGRDNITVIVVDVLDGDDPPDPTLEIDVIPVWADDAADPTPAGPIEVDADPNHGGVGADTAAAGAPPHTGRKKGAFRFAIAFGVAALLVAGFVLFTAWARSGYFVAFNGNDQAIIYKGRSGGVLWVDPTAENEAGPDRDELEPQVAAEIDDEPRFDSFEAAANFILDGVTTTTTTTTSTTTTTIAPSTTTTSVALAPTGVTTTNGP